MIKTRTNNSLVWSICGNGSEVVERWSTESRRVSSLVMIYHVMSHLLSLITSVGSRVGGSLGNYVGNVTSLNDILATHNLFVSSVNVTEANFITIIILS